MRTHTTQQYARSEYHTQIANMSFDKIFDLTAGGVCFHLSLHQVGSKKLVVPSLLLDSS